MVYVLNNEGEPLMPTKRYGKVRHLLKSGKAKVVKVRPFFTIQLLYESTNFVQRVDLKVDSGYNHVGISAHNKSKELISLDVELLKDMKKRLLERRQYRRMRRSRLRYRKARFSNRKRVEGWLAPSLKHKYESHLRIIDMIKSIIPIDKVYIEVANFDTQKIKNPDINGTEYQEGVQKDFFNVREYIFHRDNHKCKNPKCKYKDKADNQILRVHHHKYWIKNYVKKNNPDDLITVCTKCHTAKNHKEKGDLYGWKPIISKDLKEATFMSVVRWKLINNLNATPTYGYKTKSRRIELDLPKTHHDDAFAMENFYGNQERCETLFLRQKRRNNRSLETFKDAKYIDVRTGEKVSASDLFCGRSTRNKNLNTENLRIYRGEKVSKGIRSVRTKRYEYQPYDEVLYNGKRYQVRGIQNKGAYIKLYNLRKVPKVSDIKPLYYGKQFILINNK